MAQHKKSIGILGGMGPQASAYLYRLLNEMSVKYFNAKNNNDFPEIILYSLPVPDFISNKRNARSALRILKHGIANLNKQHVTSVSIACNTAHILYGELQKKSKAPIVSMIQAVVKKTKDDDVKKVGLLAGPITFKCNIYQDALLNVGIETIVPTKRNMIFLERVIREVIAGDVKRADVKKLTAIAESLRNRGAEAIILGCTELPLVFSARYKKIPVYNSVWILSLALLQDYYNKPPQIP